MQQWGGSAFRLKLLCCCLGLEGEHAPETINITESNAIMLLLPFQGNPSFNFIEVSQKASAHNEGVYLIKGIMLEVSKCEH